MLLPLFTTVSEETQEDETYIHIYKDRIPFFCLRTNRASAVDVKTVFAVT